LLTVTDGVFPLVLCLYYVCITLTFNKRILLLAIFDFCAIYFTTKTLLVHCYSRSVRRGPESQSKCRSFGAGVGLRSPNFSRQALSLGCHIHNGTYLMLSLTLTIMLTILTLTVTVRVTLTLLTLILGGVNRITY